MFHHRSSAAAILSAALLFAPIAAGAAETQRIEVHAGDLNLTTDAGRAVLQQRLTRAAEEVCGAYHGLTTARAPAYAACTHAALARVMPQFDAMVAAASSQKVAASR